MGAVSMVVWLVMAGCTPKEESASAVSADRVMVSQPSPLAPRLCLSPVPDAGRQRGEGSTAWQQVAGLLAAGDLAGARAQLEGVPTHPSTEALRGVLLHLEGSAREARTVYRELVNDWPKDACLQQTAAAIYMQDREPVMARTLATDAWRLAPEDPDVLYTYALAWLQAGDESRATSALRSVVAAQPSHAGAGYLLGVDYLQRGHLDLAIPALEAARDGGIDVTEQLADAYYQAGRILDYVVLGSAAGWPMGDSGAIAKAEDPAAAWRSQLGLSADTDHLLVTLDTSMGAIHCELLWQKAPLTVLSFVGLATGQQPWTDPATGAAKKGVPLYNGTRFHRVIPGFMIQGGDPLGTGTGGPGYRFRDELDPEQKFDRAGLLAMANAGPGTNGSQFFVTDAAAPHLRGRHTVFGTCQDSDVVSAIARVPAVQQDRPMDDVVLRQVVLEARAE